ncbi:substrate-binding domain-containing protein [Desulfuromonas carbonis]|uniref:PstS family phosphate ABC transporter substrate-binding protein n=1 Tax=Desulfuromonas sp. DDH964 TaxID=1823759 RepID=UPI00078DFFA6|nr:substrate-binding domain-containing protein [Desulfuromonas sp. DDH964]AMV73430.1 Phosphate-binding protein PstS 1 precursor [Desulfuromonas sp. DDH964]
MKRTARGLNLVLLVLALTLFGGGSRALAEELAIVGTGDGVKILKALGAAFERLHPGTTITIPESIGSSGGIKAVGEGEAALGRVARTIKEKEQGYGLTYLPFARIPVVFFVNPVLPVQNLSSDQAAAIYRGAIDNWKTVGGPDAPIAVVRREEGDSSLSTLKKSLPAFKDLAITERAILTEKTPLMFEAVETTPLAIGFGPLDVARNQNVKVLSLDGRLATFPDYPVVNTLALVFKEANRKGTLQSFVEFVSAPAAAPIISAAGGVPLGR